MAEKKQAEPQTYVVQRQRHGVATEGAPAVHWEDIATVTVPPRTRRDVVVRRALEATAVEICLPETLRVLDSAAAEEIPVAARAREPELVIG